ncbi:MAG: hypothetical protein GY725_20920 [bacterium]|nr:hypothetical protein [bacterium]
MNKSQILSGDLLEFLKAEFRLDWRGIHGVSHWARVRYNGLVLARLLGANARVVELFAFLHDLRRENDSRDPEHGARAADLVREINGRFFALEPAELRLLEIACREHTNGHRRADVSVQVCWDSDRLDLGRVGIRPHPDRLCTAPAKTPEVLKAAYARSLRRPRR